MYTLRREALGIKSGCGALKCSLSPRVLIGSVNINAGLLGKKAI